ncbi:MAG TPA: HEAT repeat domain-containing protein [Myxococcaceae bacterium]|nr:HEAT repeat domain-containing protein [Myxococcaceae bacterium]
MTRSRELALGLLFSLIPAVGCAAPRTPAEEPNPPTKSRAAQAQAPLRAKLEEMLDRSAPAAEWKTVGADGVAALEQIFNDPAVQPERRARALLALAATGLPEAVAKVAEVVKDTGVDARYRAQAAAALARHGGEDVGPTLKVGLGSPDPKVREAVARALSGVGGAQVRAALEERLAEEEDASVREVIQQTLTRLEP